MSYNEKSELQRRDLITCFGDSAEKERKRVSYI